MDYNMKRWITTFLVIRIMQTMKRICGFTFFRLVYIIFNSLPSRNVKNLGEQFGTLSGKNEDAGVLGPSNPTSGPRHKETGSKYFMRASF